MEMSLTIHDKNHLGRSTEKTFGCDLLPKQTANPDRPGRVVFASIITSTRSTIDVMPLNYFCHAIGL
jgi:hypothetical protein